MTAPTSKITDEAPPDIPLVIAGRDLRTLPHGSVVIHCDAAGIPTTGVVPLVCVGAWPRVHADAQFRILWDPRRAATAMPSIADVGVPEALWWVDSYTVPPRSAMLARVLAAEVRRLRAVEVDGDAVIEELRDEVASLEAQISGGGSA